MYFENMNLQAKIDRYRKRGFQQAEAEILVLIEDTASSLFAAFPDRFILFGGAILVLFYDSPRLSRDLDLLARADELPPATEIAKVIEASIQPLSESLGIGRIDCQCEGSNQDFIKIWVQAHQRRLFSVDLTRIGGTVLQSQIVQEKLAGADDKTVIIPSANYLLFQKCEAFLDRRYTKARDAFDIDVLLQRGANWTRISKLIWTISFRCANSRPIQFAHVSTPSIPNSVPLNYVTCCHRSCFPRWRLRTSSDYDRA